MKTKNLLLIILVAMQSYTAFTQSYILRDDPAVNPNPAAGTINTNIYQNGAYIGINTLNPVGTTEITGTCGTNNSGTLTLTTDQVCAGGQTFGEQFLVRRRSFLGVITNDFVIKPNGRVGVGNMAPDAVFDVRGQSTSLPIAILRDNNNTIRFTFSNDGRLVVGSNATPVDRFEVFNGSSGSLFRVQDVGRIGINSTTPTASLEVKSVNSAHNPLRVVSVFNTTKLIVRNDARHVIIGGEDAINNAALTVNETNNNGGIELLSTYGNSNQVYNQIFFTKFSGGNRHFIGDDNSNGRLVIDPGVGAGATDILQIKGKTIIGNAAPTGTYNTYQLGVDGDIVAKKVIVQTGNWADYVFDDNYNLATLDEVAAFIKENKHLPEIPSEKEILANGIDTGEMNRLLLQKVEELTLYLIEMKKEIETLKN
jgi:hypothetical protein